MHNVIIAQTFDVATDMAMNEGIAERDQCEHLKARSYPDQYSDLVGCFSC